MSGEENGKSSRTYHAPRFNYDTEEIPYTIVLVSTTTKIRDKEYKVSGNVQPCFPQERRAP